MAQRRSLAWSELKVGMLVIVSFALLAFAVFLIGGQSSLFVPKYTITAYFANANNLKSGAEVQLEGVTVGNVTEVGLSTESDPAKAVYARMRLVTTYQNIIRSDSQVAIKTVGLLGDQYVEIAKGSEAGQVVPDGGTLIGTEAGDIERIIESTDDFVANLEILSDKITKMADRVDRGEGTLGKLLTDSSIYDNADLAMREAIQLVRDARTGPGTLGRLISDDEFHRNLNKIAESIDSLVDKINSGSGTAGKLVNDPELYNKATTLVAKLESITDRIDRGEGTLGKLMTDESLHTELRDTITKVNSLVASVQSGAGTAGKFIQDPTLYNTANQASSEILKLIYDFRQDPKKYLTINFRLF